MAHLPPKTVLKPDPSAQSKTLFLPAPGELGTLVTLARGKHSARVMRFKGPHAALDWCLTNRAGLVFSFGPPTALN